jgi:hypothetical protein
MDALRIFDEKMRDGLIEEESGEEPPAGGHDGGFDDAFSELLSEDVLGLAEIDTISAQLPKAFVGVTPFDPVDAERRTVGELAPHLTAETLDRISLFLAKFAKSPHDTSAQNGTKGLIVLLSSDRLMGHALTSVCGSAAIEVIVEESTAQAGETIAAATAGGRRPCLVIDTPAGNNPPVEEFCAMVCENHPQAMAIRLVSPAEQHLVLQAYRAGARAVIPRPSANGNSPSFTSDLIDLLEIIPAYVQSR